MKPKLKNILRLLVVATIVYCASAFISNNANAQDSQSLLWKIEGKGLKKPSYLYGTIHAICKNDFFLTESAINAINEVEQVVLELDMDDPQLMQKMQQGAVNEGMKNISGEFTAEQKKIVDDFMKSSFGADLTQLGVMKPFAMLSMVIQKSIPCEAVESYEMNFVSKAQERGIEVLGLETVAFQTGLFDDVPMEKQINLLVSSITDFDEGVVEFKEMVTAYKNQDLERLAKIMGESDQYAEFEDLMINDRNKSWIPTIERMASEKATIFGVGALHLTGEEGVIQLLKNKGYKLTPVK